MRYMNIRLVICLFLATVTAGCTGLPNGVEAVSNFDINRYQGAWYEIARLDHRFEKGLTNVSAEYELLEEGAVKVINRGYDCLLYTSPSPRD